MLEKTLGSPLDCKEIQPVHPKGDQSWLFTGRTEVEAETWILWLPDVESWLTGKDPDAEKDWRQEGQEEKGTTEDEMAGWHHWLDERESEWTLGVGDGHGGLVCWDSWGRKESDTTERLNWTDGYMSFPGGARGKESAYQCRRHKTHGFNLGFQIPWHRKWQPTPGFLPGKSHGQRSLVSYNPWGHKESDMTKQLSTYILLSLWKPYI